MCVILGNVTGWVGMNVTVEATSAFAMLIGFSMVVLATGLLTTPFVVTWKWFNTREKRDN